MKFRILMVLAAMMLFAAPMFAQNTAGGSSSGGFVLSVAFAMAIASGLCGLAQGRAIASAVESIARNPGAAGGIRTALLLGLAFVESLALLTFIAFLQSNK